METERDHPFDSPRGFLAFFLDEPYFEINDIFDATAQGRVGNIFRGQANADWVLLPRAHRLGDPLSSFTPQTPGQDTPDTKTKVPHLGVQLHAELRAVHLFLEAADKAGIPNPLDYRLVLEHADLIQAAFSGLAGTAFSTDDDFPKDDLLPEIAFAQHYGVPTRLLDWTESPLVAAYFAAVEHSVLQPVERRSSAGKMAVVWFDCLQGKKSDPVRVLSATRYQNTNLRVQRGLFTHTPRSNAYFLKNLRWPSLEDALADTKSALLLNRATLPASAADALLRLLFKYDITRHHLFPTLENAALAFKYANALWPA